MSLAKNYKLKIMELEHELTVLNSRCFELSDELEHFKNEWRKVVGNVNNINEKIERSSSRSILLSEERSLKDYSVDKFGAGDAAFSKAKRKKSDSFVVVEPSDLLKSIEKNESEP